MGGGILSTLKRIKLKNRTFTLIANNCCGGIIYHSLGGQFRSPTINLFIRTEDYFTFLENLDEALNTDIVEIKVDKTGVSPRYPLGEMQISDGSTIQIHFVHYRSFTEARSKWHERCRRVNKDNLYILMELGVETTPEYVEKFQNLKFKNKVAITNSPFPEYDSTICIDIYGEGYKPGLMVYRIPGTLKRYIELFDYIHWLNTGEIRYAKYYKKYIQ